MATLVLSTVGAALGAPFGPLGVALGRAAGGLLGNALDNRLLGEDVEGPRLGDVSLTLAEEGTPIPRAYGTVRASGHLIWATRFEERASEERQGGKGRGPTTTTYSYFGNAAYALCEGPIAMVRRVWADARELDLTEVEMRVHRGTEDQLPDPLILAKQGGDAPAYRGTAYVVFERLPLDAFGNRLPQLSFEIVRAFNPVAARTRAVTIIPGASEYAYAPYLVTDSRRRGETTALNRHVLHAGTDWEAAIDELTALCPNLRAVSLVVAWFGDDLDCARCKVRPGVETQVRSGASEVWRVAGRSRATAHLVSRHDDGPAYGGTPSDEAVVAAIADLKARGLEVFLYPFLLMDVPPDNELADPYGRDRQSAYPWRGRMSCSPAPGRPGTVDGTAAAREAVAAFVGDTDAPNYAAFVQHCAELCLRAGGVDGFVIGSEMRGLTTLRDGDDRFPFVEALRQIATAAKATLGPGTAITYAADWSEYFGHQPDDGSGDVFFHLDPLWADPAIDAVGIDNYLPIADFRDEDGLDGGPDGLFSPHDVDGLERQVAGGERLDWYYADEADRRARRRTPIADGAHGKPWVFAPKAIATWWSERHYERRGGVELPTSTAWVPRSKPVWFTELGAPAADKAANQPNVFPDPKSSESAYPHFSSGARDDLAQHAFLEAQMRYWADPANMPANASGESMLPEGRTFLWTWDARPIPAFPTREDVWSDGGNWNTGHWLNGRFSGGPLAALLAAVLNDHGVRQHDTRDVEGWATGLLLTNPADARSAIARILAQHGIGTTERDGRLILASRTRRRRAPEPIDVLAVAPDAPEIATTRSAESTVPTEIVVAHRDPMRDHGTASQRVRLPAARSVHREAIDTSLVLEADEAAGLAERILRARSEPRDAMEVRLPWSEAALRPGDLVSVQGGPAMVIEELVDGRERTLTLSTAPDPAAPRARAATRSSVTAPVVRAGPPLAIPLDLPPIPPDASTPVVAAWQRPWQPLAVLARREGAGFAEIGTIDRPALVGRLASPLAPGPVGPVDRVNVIDVAEATRGFESLPERAVLDGANAIAIRSEDGWEVLQFMHADEVEPDRWHLSHLLRARLGTEHAMLAGAPPGADLVALDGAPLAVAPGTLAPRDGERWIVGPLGSALDGGRFAEIAPPLEGEARRPRSPVHLRARVEGGGALALSWVRRGRVDADAWEPADIPLGEAFERYVVNVERDGARETFEVDEPRLLYAGPLTEPLSISVAQLGSSFGPGHAATITVNPS